MTSKPAPCAPQHRTRPADVNRFLAHLYAFTGLTTDSELCRVTGLHNAELSRWKTRATLSAAALEKLFAFLAEFLDSPAEMRRTLRAWGWELGDCEQAVLQSVWLSGPPQRLPPPPQPYLPRPELEDAIRPEAHNLLLVGLPGSGRRTLLYAALRWDEHLQRRFPGGLVTLDCQGLSAAEITHALAESSGFPSLRALFRARQEEKRPMLFVLFNLEDRRAWETLQDIFTPYRPARLILTTSRDFPVRYPDTFRRVEVPGFSAAEGLRFFRLVLGEAADAQAETLRRIIHRLRGWPLALSLLAHWHQTSAIPWETLHADLDAHLLADPHNPLRALLDALLAGLSPEQRQAAALFGLFPQPRGAWPVWQETAAALHLAHPSLLRRHLTGCQLVRPAGHAPASAWEIHPLIHAYLRQRVRGLPDFPRWQQIYRDALYAYEVSRQPPWEKQTLYAAWYRQEDLLALAESFLPARPERTLRLLLGSDLALMAFSIELPALRDLLAAAEPDRLPPPVAEIAAAARPRLDDFLAERQRRFEQSQSPLERGFAAAVLGRWEAVRAALESLSPDAREDEQARELFGVLALHEGDRAAAQAHFIAAGFAEDRLALEEHPAWRFLTDWPRQRLALVARALESG
jgi:hypothetical protein